MRDVPSRLVRMRIVKPYFLKACKAEEDAGRDFYTRVGFHERSNDVFCGRRKMLLTALCLVAQHCV